MSDFGISVLSIAIIRALVIAIGGALAYFGYRLFTLGLFQKAGDLKAVIGSSHFTIKAAAPGTFFALFSAGIMIFALRHPFTVETKTAASPNAIPVSSVPAQLTPRELPAAQAPAPNVRQPASTRTPKGSRDSSPSSIPVIATTESPEEILDKAANGQPLNEQERQILKDLKWRIHYWGVQGSIPETLKGTTSSVTEPG